VLELGGSDPFVVLADCDLELAAQTAVRARFENGGQSCIAAKRFIVVEQVADDFTAAFASGVEALRIGDPREEVDLGPMARVDLRDQLADQVDRGRAEGGRVLTGGAIPPGNGAFYEPTVVAGVGPNDTLAVEETFGPVAAVTTARDEEQAIGLANLSPYGLSSSLWTEDLDRARELASRIEAGAVFINAMTASDAPMPFGGVKRSGWGRELGVFGVREFVNVQAITIAGATRSASQ
jgi:succinate-semialdehyde dehydrogenase/glutarate-semialdehyde dehydrogenase